VTTWIDVYTQWLWAQLSDAQFVRLAERIGHGEKARDIVYEDTKDPD
jgi:hypothetical protein